MLDPRQDLKQDSALWELVLACATAYKDEQIFGNLHGFRCSGAALSIKDDALAFRFSQEWDDATKQSMKQKYALPYAKQFKELFKFAAQYCRQHKDELSAHKEKDYFARDVFEEGYPP